MCCLSLESFPDPFSHLSTVEVDVLTLAEGVVPRLTELTLVVKTVGIGDVLGK